MRAEEHDQDLGRAALVIRSIRARAVLHSVVACTVVVPLRR